MCFPYVIGARSNWEFYFLNGDIDEWWRKASAVGLADPSSRPVKLQTAVAQVPWQEVAYIQSDKCWFHISAALASVTGHLCSLRRVKTAQWNMREGRHGAVAWYDLVSLQLPLRLSISFILGVT